MPVFLPKSVSKLVKLASPDAGSYALAGVRVEPPATTDSEDLWRLVVTDGRKLAIVQGPNVIEEKLAKTRDVLQNVTQDWPDEATCIIPNEAWKRMFGLKEVAYTTIGLVPTQNEIAYALGQQSGRTPCLEGRYPDYMRALPTLPPLVECRVSPKYLAQLCEVAASLMTDEDSQGLTLLFYGTGLPLGLMCRGANGLTFDGLLMPLT